LTIRAIRATIGGVGQTSPPVLGLVLAGGRSSRMGVDKGLLDYHGRPQRVWLRDLLATRCDAAFLSLSARQAAGIDDAGVIVDDPRYETSPMGALLTASDAHPGAAWFVLSCDLAYFDAGCLNNLFDARDSARAGTAFVIPELGQPEPLATLYEAAFVATLPEQYAAGERSLRRALHRAGVKLIDAGATHCAQSVDTPEAADRARAYWRGEAL
jgi:molybdopterin-guanine dinucleotide biosynthesis protein A